MNNIGFEDRKEDKEYIFSIDSQIKQPEVLLEIAGSSVLFKIDTGASVNVIDSKTFNGLEVKPRLQAFDRMTYPYGNDSKPLEIIGCFKDKISYQDKVLLTEFIIVKETAVIY